MAVRPRTREDYARRIARAMAHIAAHLDDPPDLEALAAVAAFSPFHFHRVYREVAGETPAETLARARLSRAAVDLLRTALPIARVARRAGYGSAAAFTRAFRAAHGVPPGAYRAHGGLGALPPRPGFATRETAMHSVTFRDQPALRLAVLRHIGPYNTIAGAFDRLMAWSGPRGLIGPDSRYFALYLDDPKTVPAALLRTDVGLTVPDGTSAEGDVRVIEVPGARCAVLLHKGPYAELEPVYSWLYGAWLPNSGEEPADQPVMEEYLNDCRTLPPAEWLTEILLPLKAKAGATV